MMSKIVLLLLFLSGAASLLQAQRQITGRLSSPVLNEVSGVAVSLRHQNILYVQNDSGDSSRFFAINPEGKLITTYYFKAKLNGFAGVLDCEDIAVGPGPEKGQSYIYLADIGDNLVWRSTLQVYRFKEPALLPRADTLTADILNLTYPNGKHDAETILIDPLDKLIYIISKREDSVGVYTGALNFKNKDNVVLQQKCKLHFDNKGKKNWIVSGAIAADGTQVLLKSLQQVYYWKRLPNEPIYKTLQRTPKIQTAFVSHGQEEGIAFSPDGNSYYVTAEGAGSAIFYYKLEK